MPNQAPAAEMSTPAPAPASPAATSASADGDGSAAPSAPTGSSTTPAPVALNDDLNADDADLIEKEWVTRAKTIVENTKNDPHAQNKQISQVKAEYIKKRYNKDVKVSDS